MVRRRGVCLVVNHDPMRVGVRRLGVWMRRLGVCLVVDDVPLRVGVRRFGVCLVVDDGPLRVGVRRLGVCLVVHIVVDDGEHAHTRYHDMASRAAKAESRDQSQFFVALEI